jgi:hypothetical protein
MVLKFCKVVVVSLGLLLPVSAIASPSISISYTLVPMGGNSYKYVYSITNNGTLTGSAPVQLFDILFDTSQYQESSLQIVTPPNLNAQWSQEILTGIPPAIPAAYDALALAGGVPAGTTVTGFAVQFTWQGTGTPGPQPFEIYDPVSFALLQSGQTTSAPVSVPAASVLSLILISVGLALTVAYQTRTRSLWQVRASARLE